MGVIRIIVDFCVITYHDYKMVHGMLWKKCDY